MNRYFLIALLIATLLAGCAKNAEPTPGDGDTNYDLNNNIFRVQATATAKYSIDIIEYESDSTTPYNSQHADQTGPFDYGFKPAVGHKIAVEIKSDKGAITARMFYKGIALEPVLINTVGAGSAASFSYTIKN